MHTRCCQYMDLWFSTPGKTGEQTSMASSLLYTIGKIYTLGCCFPWLEPFIYYICVFDPFTEWIGDLQATQCQCTPWPRSSSWQKRKVWCLYEEYCWWNTPSDFLKSQTLIKSASTLICFPQIKPCHPISVIWTMYPCHKGALSNISRGLSLFPS